MAKDVKIFDPKEFDMNSFEWGAIYWINKIREAVEGFDEGYEIPDEQMLDLLAPFKKAAKVYAEAQGKNKAWVRETVLSVPETLEEAFGTLSEEGGVTRERFLKLFTVEAVCALADGRVKSIRDIEDYYDRKGIYKGKGGYKVGDIVVIEKNVPGGIDDVEQDRDVKQVLAILGDEDKGDVELVFWNARKTGLITRKASDCSEPFPSWDAAMDYKWDDVTTSLGDAGQSEESKVYDELYGAILESMGVVEDAEPEKGSEGFWEEHDRKHHHGHYDPETQICTLRDEAKAAEARREKEDAEIDDLEVGEAIEEQDGKVTEEEEAEYLDAVLRGDMETAAQMVQEAAAKAFPDTKVVDGEGHPLEMFHFGRLGIDHYLNYEDDNDPYLPHTPVHFGTRQAAADRESATTGGFDADEENSYGTTSYFLNIKNPFDAQDGWGKTHDAKVGSDVVHDGYDGNRYENVIEGKGSVSWVAYNPSQIKSSAPIEYDDKGMVIPLSKRFNDGDDIRGDGTGGIDIDRLREYKALMEKKMPGTDAMKALVKIGRMKNPDAMEKAFREMMESGSIAQDSEPDMADADFWMKHDRAHHHGHFDPNTQTCKLREKAKAQEVKREQIDMQIDDMNPSEIDSGNEEDNSQGNSLKEFADNAKSVFAGTDIEIVDEDKFAGEGEAGKRQSIGGIFTGSGADYDKPSLLHIGEGEGSQVYGWGLYGSTVRGVAEGYMPRERTQDERKYIDFLKRQVAFEQNPALKKYWEDELSLHGKGGRNLYSQTFFTDRAPGDESHLLKWYEPIDDVARDAFKKAARELGVKLVKRVLPSGRKYETVITRDGTESPIRMFDGGEYQGELYHMLAYATSPKEASEALARAGIDGVKYPVDSYGGKGVKDGDEAGWNYVSFRDDNIRVDYKWVDGKQMYMVRADGRILGEYDRSTGKIKLYKGATVHTLVHELGGHATMQFAQQCAEAGNDTLLKKINESIDMAPKNVWDEVKSKYLQAKDESAEEYDERLRDEVWAAVVEGKSKAIEEAKQTKEGQSWWKKAWNTVKACWAGVLGRMGVQVDWTSKEVTNMTPSEFQEFIVKSIKEGQTLGSIKKGGEGKRYMLEPGTYQKISDAIHRYKAKGVKFSPFTESIVSMLQRGGRKQINLPGFNPTPLIIETPAYAGSVHGRYDLDHSALKHNWEGGKAYTGYYTWTEFDRAFRDNNLKKIQRVPSPQYEGQEKWMWRVSYPKTDSHEAYELTWKIIRDKNTGKMLDLFTTRGRNEYPPKET